MINIPFLRLVRVHALGAAGDAMITVALAGSLFFSIDPSAARLRVTLYLLLTMAPFAVVGPLIGPALDRFRGGRRPMILAINGGRAFFAFLMISNMDSLLLFPLAFAMLVLQKSYGVAKASMVPLILPKEE
ncbi:MAG: MFS transporter, partial [bacterium]|nr:MFS transporter [bacterium]